MKNLMINIYFYSSLIMIPFAFLFGYKIWKAIISEKDSSEVFCVGSVYGSLFILSVLLSIILTEISHNYL